MTEEDSEAYETKLGGVGSMNTQPPHPAMRIISSPQKPRPTFWRRLVAACQGAWWGLRSGWRQGEWQE